MGDNPTLAIEWWPVDRPIDYPNNARKWSQKAVEKVATSIREFGFVQPIVVDSAGVIIIGHLRRTAARFLELLLVPVHVAANLSTSQVKALRLADNRSHEESTWDEDLLRIEFSELKSLEFDLALTAFDTRQVDAFLGPLAGETDPDDVPEVPIAPVSIAGDLWVLGDHRLLCGDSTNCEDVSLLMNGERAGLFAIDPPYGISYDSAELHEHGVSYARIDGDHHEDEKLQSFLESAFSAALVALREDAAWYMWHAMLTQGFFAAAAAAAAAAHVILHRQIIWVKPVLVFGRGQFHWRHELCFMGWVKGNQPPDYSEHKDTTVWEVAGVKLAERREFKHSSPKPVELFRRPILKHLRPGEIAYDAFSGTGPQFIAAEENGRRCFGMEIEPANCDVIVIRWQKFTGRTATHAETGATFEQVRFGRRLGMQDELKEEALGRA